MLRGRHQAERLPCYWFIKIQIETFSFEPPLVFPRKVRLRILSMDCSTLTSRTQLASSKEIAQTCSHVLLDFPKSFTGGGNKMRQHSLQRVLQAKLLWPWPKGEYDCCCPLIQPFSTRYLTPPATSTAVERLFSAAGLIMDSKRNKLSPTFVDKLLFLREAHLLGICKLDWK